MAIPSNTSLTEGPFEFLSELVAPNKIIHKGLLSNDMKTYYFTISNLDYTDFDIVSVRYDWDLWTTPSPTFFNSDADDHGMSISPDGKTIYFSSTRETGVLGQPYTWHLWKTELVDTSWTSPEYIDIPNMEDKLVSHPSITNDGRLYFHSSNLDFTEMYIYTSQQIDGTFQDAVKVDGLIGTDQGACTPYIAPDGSYLIYAGVGKTLDLYITYKDDQGDWSTPNRLSDEVNNNGQGNPAVTVDGKLFYTTNDNNAWQVKWIPLEEAFAKAE